MRVPGPLRPVVIAGGSLLAAGAAGASGAAGTAGRAGIRAGRAGAGTVRSAAGAPLRGMTAALSLPARPAGIAVSAAGRAASAAVRDGASTAARVRASAAAVADIGPARRRRRVWSAGGRAHIEVRGLSGHGPEHRRLAADVTSALTGLKGVSWAEVNAVTGHVLAVFDEDQTGAGELVQAVEAVEKAHGTDSDDFPWARGQFPADDSPAASAAAVLAADCLAMAWALTGRLARLAAPPRTLRAALALIDAQPRSRPALARHLGPAGADLVIAVSNAVAHGLTEGELPLVTDAAQRLLNLAELRANRAAWERRELELHSTGHSLPSESHRRMPRPVPFPHGPIEDAAERISAASLAGAGAILAWARDPGRAADAILATAPKAARLGREGFASVLGRELADRGVVALDGAALRRLDRVSAVVIDSAVLCTPRPVVLSAASATRELDGAQVWQLAERVLDGRSAPELRGAGPWARGHWRLAGAPRAAARARRPAGCGPAGLTLELGDTSGRRYGKVVVGLELDPLADAVLGAARGAAAQVLLSEHDSVADVVPQADAVLSPPVPLAEHVRRLQEQGHGVLTVSAGDDEALAASDVGIGVLRPAGAVCWSADLICGPGLGDVCRVLRAAGAAREVSQRSARLSAGGSAVGALLITVRSRPGRRRGGLTPVHTAALAALVSGAVSARSVARRPAPAPMPRGNWHAMSAEDVFARLRGLRSPPDSPGGRTGSAAPGTEAAGTEAAGTELPAQGAGRKVASAAASPARTTLEFARLVREELQDPLTPVLALGAVASAVVGSGVDAALVSSVMAGNALISGAQRMRAERALRRLLLGEEVSARRVLLPAGDVSFAAVAGAAAETVRGRELAAGDVIRLGPSDVVPADARLLLADDLEVDESTLTGESVPVTKNPDPAPGAPLGDRTCMMYEGTSVLAGTAHAVVTATGPATEAGRAASDAEHAAPPGGLQARLAELTRIALPATGVGGLAVTGIGLLRGLPLRQAMASGVAVAVAAVPEGLPLVATVSELAAARRLSTRGVLVRTARALEALGRVDTVCFDKTGTLTEGRIAVARLALPGADIPLDSTPGRRLLQVAARACPRADGGTTGRMAHATDRAVVAAAAAHAGTDSSWRLLDELPFETSRGFAASIGEVQGRPFLAVKGAPEIVLARCTAITIPRAGRGATATGAGPGGTAAAGPGATAAAGPGATAAAGAVLADLTPARRRRAQALVRDLAAEGLRVIAVAETSRPGLAEVYRAADGQLADVADGLTLAGFVAFADPSRPSARQAVRSLRESGVRVVMITGDHPVTASTIARQIGIPEAGRVLAGPEIASLPDAVSTARISESTVFARVSPEQKVHIIRSLQRAGHVVAMTGDGTNDAAAIRVADVGIGVSARGSTAARSSSDLVLTDSDPARIADALLEGRALWASARDAVSILLGGNAGEVSFVLLGTALSGRAPLNTRQLLLVNLLTDMLPALAVAVAPAAPPGGGNGRPAAAGPVGSFMGNGLLRDVGVRGGATALGALAAWQAGRMTGRRGRAETMGLAGLVLTELGQTLLANWRSPLVVATSGVSAAVLAGIVETPGVSRFFGCTPLGPVAWATATGSAAGATVASAVAPRLLERLLPAGEGPGSMS